jgi:hypothetical protein
MMMHGRQGPSRSRSEAMLVSLLLCVCAMLLAVASGTVMDSSGAAFTYTRFGAFVFFVVCTITAAILEVISKQSLSSIPKSLPASSSSSSIQP